MSIRELSRLKQMKIENFSVERARAELMQVRERLTVEDAVLKQRLAAASRIEQQLKQTQAEFNELAVRSRDETLELRNSLEAMARRSATLEGEKLSMQSQVEAQAALITDLQAAAARAAPEGVVEADVGTFLRRFSDELTGPAIREDLSGFTISHLDIDLHVPVGIKNDRPVVRFASTDPTGPESASRIQFRLEKTVRVRPVDEGE